MSDPHHSPARQLIVNPVLGDAVVQTPGRMNRREGVSECPFCADIASGRWPPEQDTWMRPNDFPPLQPPLGECYVLLYAREHDRSFVDLGIPGIARVVDLWQQAYADLAARHTCVMTFENSGEAIGQTQQHPHGQTYGVAFLPPTIQREWEHIVAHEAATGECLLCATLAAEAEGPRIVRESAQWVGFIPRWARYPYEVHLYARPHVANLCAFPRGGAAAYELAEHLHAIIRAYNIVNQGPMPYMLVIHQLADPRYHAHLELLPVGRAPGKLKYAASAETGFGLWLNDAIPEAKAAELRAIIAHG
jgi:UDPglucose--hexose-1-phosphate uridylyltransferase